MASSFFTNKVLLSPITFPCNLSQYELGLEVIIKAHGHRHNCGVSMKY